MIPFRSGHGDLVTVWRRLEVFNSGGGRVWRFSSGSGMSRVARVLFAWAVGFFLGFDGCVGVFP